MGLDEILSRSCVVFTWSVIIGALIAALFVSRRIYKMWRGTLVPINGPDGPIPVYPKEVDHGKCAGDIHIRPRLYRD